jgi:hypothetical protein
VWTVIIAAMPTLQTAVWNRGDRRSEINSFKRASAIKARPDDDDVVVRQERGDASTVYVLHRAFRPDQLIVRTRDEAVAQALAFAKRAQVAAWFTSDEHDFVLLGTCRKVEIVRPS